MQCSSLKSFSFPAVLRSPHKKGGKRKALIYNESTELIYMVKAPLLFFEKKKLVKEPKDTMTSSGRFYQAMSTLRLVGLMPNQ